jgi:glucosamine--fructose-6-phosphate aminotransferase (isomerizing)
MVKLGGLNSHKDDLLKIRNLLIIASGTSYYAGLLGSYYFRLLKCFNTVRVIDAAEFILDDIPKENPGIVVLSQSGETKDVHCAIELAKNLNVIIIGIVNVVGSLISRDSDCGIYLNAGREVAVASTKSFTSQVIVLSLMAIWFSQNQGNDLKFKRSLFIENIRNLSIIFTDIIKDISIKINDSIIHKLSQKNSLFILGRGSALPIALEASLKLKEIAYIHAEGYAGGALKHGPFALIEKDFPIIIILLDDEYKDRMISAIEQVKARGAFTIVITNINNIDESLYDYKILLPNAGILSSLITILPFQYLAYKLALYKGYNPDFPRNLAKSVVTL